MSRTEIDEMPLCDHPIDKNFKGVNLFSPSPWKGNSPCAFKVKIIELRLQVKLYSRYVGCATFVACIRNLSEKKSRLLHYVLRFWTCQSRSWPAYSLIRLANTNDQVTPPPQRSNSNCRLALVQ